MTRQELEGLCQPLTPEQSLKGLEALRDEYNLDESSQYDLPESLFPVFDALNAGINVFEGAIEETLEMPPSVKTRRQIW